MAAKTRDLEAAALAKVYKLILSWEKPDEERETAGEVQGSEAETSSTVQPSASQNADG